MALKPEYNDENSTFQELLDLDNAITNRKL